MTYHICRGHEHPPNTPTGKMDIWIVSGLLQTVSFVTGQAKMILHDWIVNSRKPLIQLMFSIDNLSSKKIVKNRLGLRCERKSLKADKKLPSKGTQTFVSKCNRLTVLVHRIWQKNRPFWILLD